MFPRITNHELIINAIQFALDHEKVSGDTEKV